jgi:cell division septation protein DedD
VAARSTPSVKTAPTAKQQTASVATTHSNGSYAVQIGSFSDYKRAKNYAISVKNNLAKQFAVYNIKVEKVQTASNTLYRSKVVGLAKQDAQKICQNMKQQKKSCLVIADNHSLKLAQK